MKIILAFDSFKGCLTAEEVITTASTAIIKITPTAQITTFKLADGGEGTLAALIDGCNGKSIIANFTNLENRAQPSQIGIINNDTAIIECAQTVGLPLSNLQQVELKTSYGMGEQIKHALDLGIRQFVIGLGGSGTNDAGCGMLAALGYRFLDQHANPLMPLLANLLDVCQIDSNNVDPRLAECQFTVLSDVKNPLYGQDGATYVYGSQKGIIPTQLAEFDTAINHFSSIAAKHYGYDHAKSNGAGAAGGLGYALSQFLNAKIVSGIDYVLQQLDAAHEFAQADIIFTGEGRSDEQTANGKVATGVAKLAKQYAKPVLLISGSLTESAYKLHDYGIDYLSSIQESPDTLANVIEPARAKTLLSRKIEETMRLLILAKNFGHLS